MKRIVLFLSLVVITFLLSLPDPATTSAQRKSLGREFDNLIMSAHKQKMKPRPMHNPHEGIGIDQTADKIAAVSLATTQVAAKLPPLKQGPLQKPAAKIVGESDNLIDKEIFATLAANNVEPAALATDEEFCRRLYLDLTGRQPTPEQMLSYIGSTDPDKKSKLIDTLMQSEGFVDLWTNWLGDVTRNFAPYGAFLDERNGFHFYLRDSVAKNKGFDQVAKDIIAFNGRLDKGPGNFILRPFFFSDSVLDAFDDLAGEVSTVFLGVQSTCVSCHDGRNHLESVNLYLSTKERKQFWGISAFMTPIKFSRVNRHLAINPNPRSKYYAESDDGGRPPRNGGLISPSYELFGSGVPAQKEDPRVALGRIITADPQFARVFVNRVFGRLFTIALVEPQNNFDLARLDPNNPPPAPWQLQPSHPALLNSLGSWFQQNRFDMRALIKYIASSQAYALTSRYDEAKWRPEYTRLYARKLVRRMQAEEIIDAIAAATMMPGKYYAYRIKSPFTNTMSLPGVEEPYSYYDEDPVLGFLQDFGRGDRNLVMRNDSGSITQALQLFNSDLVIDRLKSRTGLPTRLADMLSKKDLTPEEAVNTLYLMTIARRPTEAEVDRLKEQITKGPEAIGDLQWVLLNRFDFLYNY